MLRNKYIAAYLVTLGLFLLIPGPTREALGQDGKTKVDERAAWPQWFGPNRDGNSTEKGWSARKLTRRNAPVLWRKTIGIGYSSVVVRDGRAYCMGYDRSNGLDRVFCFEVSTGKELWKHSYKCGKHDNMNAGGPSGTPAVDAERVYTISREAQVFCLDAKSGKVIWKDFLRQSVGVETPTWGFSGSPLLYKEMVIVDAGPIIAFDPKTGKRLWTTKNYGAAYSSPVPFTRKRKEYLATFPEYGLVVLDPKNGTEIAKFRWETDYGVNAATPVIVKDHIFISSGYNKGAALLRFDGRSLKQIWSSRKMRNHMSTSVYSKGYLYGFDESTLRCINLQNGKEAWNKRGLGKGALSLANGMLLIQGARGELVVAAASPRGYKAIAQAKPYSKSARGCWTLPVLVDKRIYCRSPQGELVCLDVSR